MMVPPLSPISPTKGTGSPPGNSAATMNGKQVTAIIVGGGVISLATARQLDGLEYIVYTKTSCLTICHPVEAQLLRGAGLIAFDTPHWMRQ